MNEAQALNLTRLQTIAQNRGGLCLDSVYTRANDRYHFRCAQGHEWYASAASVTRGNSCRLCANQARAQKQCRPDGLNQLQDMATSKGGACLSTLYTKSQDRYRFRCRQGHEWEATGNSILMGKWCRDCANEARSRSKLRSDGLARLQEIAQEHGGQCLDTEYRGVASHYHFRCASGHAWQANANKVFRGSWCPQCAGVRVAQKNCLQDGLQRLQDMASIRGGNCLSTAYTTAQAYYHFQCGVGHQWLSAGRTVLAGTWCQECAYDAISARNQHKEGLTRLQALAQAQGGVCLDMEYQTSSHYYRFRCAAGHEWKARANKVVEGHWCPRCASAQTGRKLSLGLTLMQEIAKERGGLCLSTEYQDTGTKLQWQCHLGHVWFTIPQVIRRGHWCPECAYMERINKRNAKARLKYLPSGAHRPDSVMDALPTLDTSELK